MAEGSIGKKARYAAAAATLIIGVLISLVFLQPPGPGATSPGTPGTHGSVGGSPGITATSTPQTTWATAGDYIRLFTRYPEDFVEDYRLFEPWIVDVGCRFCINRSSVPPGVPPGELASYLLEELNRTVEKLVGNCSGSLWDYYIRFLAYDYIWLGVKGQLERYRDDAEVGAPSATSNLLLAFTYLDYLKMMGKSGLRGMFCRVGIDEARGWAMKLYRVLREDLARRYEEVKYRLTVERAVHMRSKYLCSVSIPWLQTRIKGYLRERGNESFEDIFLIIDYLIVVYILANNAIDAILYADNPMGVGANISTILSNYTYMAERHRETLDSLRRLGNLSKWPKYMALIIRHAATRYYFRSLEIVARALGEDTPWLSNSTLMSPGVFDRFFGEQANPCRVTVDVLYYKDTVDRLYQVLEGTG